MAWYDSVWQGIKSAANVVVEVFTAAPREGTALAPFKSDEEASGFITSLGTFAAAKAPGGQGANAAAVLNMAGGE